MMDCTVDLLGPIQVIRYIGRLLLARFVSPWVGLDPGTCSRCCSKENHLHHGSSLGNTQEASTKRAGALDPLNT